MRIFLAALLTVFLILIISPLVKILFDFIMPFIVVAGADQNFLTVFRTIPWALPFISGVWLVIEVIKTSKKHSQQQEQQSYFAAMTPPPQQRMPSQPKQSKASSPTIRRL
jgi:hypothetical protein